MERREGKERKETRVMRKGRERKKRGRGTKARKQSEECITFNEVNDLFQGALLTLEGITCTKEHHL
jgi:hypothetical protein